jgi:phage baseplate assembly protein gpV
MEEQYITKSPFDNKKRYFKDRAKTILHRLDGPAVEYANGTREWHVNGVPHRMDGPAFDSIYGHREWYVNGKRHREDGPAVEYADGDKAWHVNGVFIMTVDKEGKVVKRMV